MTSCGTGGFTGALPGDPSNNSILTATSVYGGVNVFWTYPDSNAAAVAHVRLYRSTSDAIGTAVLHRIVNANFFFDPADVGAQTQYWYWIEIVSVHGTVGDTIGPVTATAKPLINDMLQQLANQIDEGLLATALKTEVSKIETLGINLAQEAQFRIAADNAIVALVATAQGEVEETRAMMISEQQVRATADDAFVTSLNQAYVAIGENQALVQAESLARADAVSVLAQQITTVQGEMGDDLASVQQTLQTNINTVDGKANQIGALYTVQLTAGGLAGGFGIYNDGSSVQAGFDVDEFFLGRTGADAKKPFIMTDGVLYLNEIVVELATISRGNIFNLAINDEIKSTNYLPGSHGFSFKEDGTFELSGGTFRGQVIFASAPSGQENINYANLGGTKPPSNANRTQDNTSANTLAVAGTAAATVRDNAARTANWVKPNTTTIDGNKITTGFAYVDTLEIKGQAVTVPIHAFTQGSVDMGQTTIVPIPDSIWTAVQTATITTTGSTVQVIVSCLYSTSPNTNIFGQGMIYFRLRRGSTTFGIEGIFGFYTDPALRSFSFTIDDTPGAGTHTYVLEGASMHDAPLVRARNRSMKLVETKR